MVKNLSGTELLTAMYRWYVIVIYILIGSLIGGIGAYIFPAPYRASAAIYIAFDPYRAVEDRYVASFANVEFRNPDDYKYWQMMQLNATIFFEDYLQETLLRLRVLDSWWSQVDSTHLRNMLHVYWREAGQWHLVAEYKDPLRASQAVSVWRDVILEKTQVALDASRKLFQIEGEMRVLESRQATNGLKLVQLPQVKQGVIAWKTRLLQQKSDQLVSNSEYWELWSLATQIADIDISWRTLLSEFPSQLSTPDRYQPLLDRLLITLDQEEISLQTEQNYLEKELIKVHEQWQTAFQTGRGLSATLYIEMPSTSAPQITRLRSSSLAILVGGISGLLFWGLTVLYQLTRRQS